MIDLKNMLSDAQSAISKNGGPEAVQKLVREHYGDIEAIDDYQATPIVAAHEIGRLEMLRQIANRGDISIEMVGGTYDVLNAGESVLDEATATEVLAYFRGHH